MGRDGIGRRGRIAIVAAGAAWLVALADLIVQHERAPMIGHIQVAVVVMVVSGSVVLLVAAEQLPRRARAAGQVASMLAIVFLTLSMTLLGGVGDDTEPLYGAIDPESTFWVAGMAFMAITAGIAAIAGARRLGPATIGWWIAAASAAVFVVVAAIGPSLDGGTLMLEALGAFGGGAALAGIIGLVLEEQTAIGSYAG